MDTPLFHSGSTGHFLPSFEASWPFYWTIAVPCAFSMTFLPRVSLTVGILWNFQCYAQIRVDQKFGFLRKVNLPGWISIPFGMKWKEKMLKIIFSNFWRTQSRTWYLKLSSGLKKLLWSWMLQRGSEVHAISLSNARFLEWDWLFFRVQEVKSVELSKWPSLKQTESLFARMNSKSPFQFNSSSSSNHL